MHKTIKHSQQLEMRKNNSKFQQKLLGKLIFSQTTKKVKMFYLIHIIYIYIHLYLYISISISIYLSIYLYIYIYYIKLDKVT